MRESKQGQLENGLYIFAKKKLLKKDLEEKGKKIGVEKPNNESVASTLAKDSHHLRFWKRKLSQKRWLCLRLTKNCFKNWKQWVSLLIRATIGSTSALHFSACFLSIGFWLTNKQSLPRFGLGRLLMYEASRDWMEFLSCKAMAKQQ
ncbi:hypothetical protein PTKIN_Ptkin08bG0075800 [Pterospermum kingtungense]